MGTSKLNVGSGEAGQRGQLGKLYTGIQATSGCSKKAEWCYGRGN